MIWICQLQHDLDLSNATFSRENDDEPMDRYWFRANFQRIHVFCWWFDTGWHWLTLVDTAYWSNSYMFCPSEHSSIHWTYKLWIFDFQMGECQNLSTFFKQHENGESDSHLGRLTFLTQIYWPKKMKPSTSLTWVISHPIQRCWLYLIVQAQNVWVLQHNFFYCYINLHLGWLNSSSWWSKNIFWWLKSPALSVSRRHLPCQSHTPGFSLSGEMRRVTAGTKYGTLAEIWDLKDTFTYFYNIIHIFLKNYDKDGWILGVGWHVHWFFCPCGWHVQPTFQPNFIPKSPQPGQPGEAVLAKPWPCAFAALTAKIWAHFTEKKVGINQKSTNKRGF